jgi:hypothetical protein
MDSLAILPIRVELLRQVDLIKLQELMAKLGRGNEGSRRVGAEPGAGARNRLIIGFCRVNTFGVGPGSGGLGHVCV